MLRNNSIITVSAVALLAMALCYPAGPARADGGRASEVNISRDTELQSDLFLNVSGEAEKTEAPQRARSEQDSIPYRSYCTTLDYADSYSYVFFIPFSDTLCLQGYAMRFEACPYGDNLQTARVCLSYSGIGGPEPGAQVTLELLGDNGSGLPDPTNVIDSCIIGGEGHEGDLYPGDEFGYVTWPLV